MMALESLRSADREFLASHWRDLFKCDPPPRVHIATPKTSPSVCPQR